MSDCFDHERGSSPLLISIPHDGRSVPPAIAKRMAVKARELPDTDWHVRRLYEFAEDIGAGVIAAKYSRYVVDLNRADTDDVLYQGRFTTGLIPLRTFDGDNIYQPGEEVGPDERADRIEEYWRPYHDRIRSSLQDIRARFGYALLWDAHSIPSEVPLLFDGELPELNFGTNQGRSCAGGLIDSVIAAARADKRFSIVLDGRFKGGFITRHYGEPSEGVHAIQLELAQRCYMIEASREFDKASASRLQSTLRDVLQAFLASAASRYEGGE